MSLTVVILAAGQGKRMFSQKPKVLHKMAGRSLLQHVYATAQALQPAKIIVVCGHLSEQVKTACHLSVTWIEQEQQLGTGHAVLQALPAIDPTHKVLVLPGDVPCLTLDTLSQLMKTTPSESVGILTALVSNPFGLGRILRDKEGHFVNIVEERDADEKQRQIKEINAGVMFAPASVLNEYLPQIKPHNNQKEYYLTDLPALAKSQGLAVNAYTTYDEIEILGVNDRAQLAQLERHYQQKQAQELLLKGVMLRDPKRFDLRGELSVGQDSEFDINVIVEGKVQVGMNCVIGANTVLRNVTIGNNVHIKENCVIEDTVIGDDCTVGPFARLRPGTHLSDSVNIGNFVEVKKSNIGNNSKVNHLSYIGDATIGKKVNIGAGTITCNYDGVNKWQTIIEDEAFIGSNTALVAPIKIGYKATIGAGSTINKDAPENKLSLARAKQMIVPNWQRPEEGQE